MEIIGSFFIRAILTGLFVVLLAAAFVIWLRQRKSDEDKRAYTDVLNEPRCKDTHTPEEYLKAVRDRDEHG